MRSVTKKRVRSQRNDLYRSSQPADDGHAFQIILLAFHLPCPGDRDINDGRRSGMVKPLFLQMHRNSHGQDCACPDRHPRAGAQSCGLCPGSLRHSGARRRGPCRKWACSEWASRGPSSSRPPSAPAPGHGRRTFAGPRLLRDNRSSFARRRVQAVSGKGRRQVTIRYVAVANRRAGKSPRPFLDISAAFQKPARTVTP